MLVCELKQAIVAIKPIDLMIPIKLYSFSVFFAIVENTNWINALFLIFLVLFSFPFSSFSWAKQTHQVIICQALQQQALLWNSVFNQQHSTFREFK